MKISAKVREQAAMIAAANASSEHTGLVGWCDNDDETRATLGVSPEAVELYWAAWTSVMVGNPVASADEAWMDAEAEALLRTGWTP